MIKPIESPRLQEALDMLNEIMKEIADATEEECECECECECDLEGIEEKFYDFATQMFAMLREYESQNQPIFQNRAVQYGRTLREILDMLL